MLKYTVTCENGRGNSEMNGQMVTKGEALGLCKCIGLSLGRLMKTLPRDAALEALDALMAGMEEAKQEQDN